MGIWTAFHDFDPLKGEVAFSPFPELQNIIWRARQLLRKRTSAQIKEIAQHADAYVDAYFEAEKLGLIERLKYEDRTDCLEFNDRGEAIDVIDNPEEDLDYANPDNTNEFDALSEALETITFVHSSLGFKPEKYEYFAVLALLRAADIHLECKFEYDLTTRNYIEREKLDKSDYLVWSAGRDTIEAMQTVCYAEQLKNIDELTRSFQSNLPKIGSIDLDLIRKQAADDVRKKDKERLAAHLKEGNRKRHERNNRVKNLVQNDFAKDPKKFKSAEDAGRYYVEHLQKQNITRSQRVVVAWISEEAKRSCVSFRIKKRAAKKVA